MGQKKKDWLNEKSYYIYKGQITGWTKTNGRRKREKRQVKRSTIPLKMPTQRKKIEFQDESSDTLIGETFARETFANFANFGLFRGSLSRKSFQNGNSRKFIQWNFSEKPIRESLSSETFI